MRLIRDKAGSPREIIGYLLDITERKEFEQQLRKSRDEWEKTFDAMSDIITIQDADMHIIRANRATNEFFKATPGELNGKHCYEIFRGVDAPCPRCPMLETLQDKGNHCIETIEHKQLGKIFHVSSASVLDEDGKLQYLVHVAKDITDVKRLEKELFQAHKMEAIGTLAGGIAHDFNNILVAILGFSEMVRDEVPEGSVARDDIEEVLKAGRRAKELVRQILSFSRKGCTEHTPLKPSLIVKEVLKLMYSSLPSTISIESDIDSDCGVIMADPSQLHQILVNLCTNAFHAMENEKGILHVSLTGRMLSAEDLAEQASMNPGAYVELVVSDTGVGMTRMVLERIFEPYFTTKATGKGTGMGMAVVHGIVQSHDGMITVESVVGEGTRVHVFFPSVEKQMADEDKQKRALPTGTERIMAVDDESTIIKMYKAFLGNLGYEVTGFTSSADALTEFQQSPDSFDLIITDQTMPNITGADLSVEALKIRPDMPIILCTGYSTMISAGQAKEIGIRKFALKPVERQKLAKMVREVLDGTGTD